MAEAVAEEEAALAKEEVGAEAEAADLSRTTFGKAPILRLRAQNPIGTSRPQSKHLEPTTEPKVAAKARKEKARERAGARERVLTRDKAKATATSGWRQALALAPTARSPIPVDTLPRLFMANSRVGKARLCLPVDHHAQRPP